MHAGTNHCREPPTKTSSVLEQTLQHLARDDSLNLHPAMSSPLSSLKKGSRNPNNLPNLPGHTPGHRPIPFRHPEYSEDESRLLEEITTSMVASRHKARDPFSAGLPSPSMETSPNPSMLKREDEDDEDDDEEGEGGGRGALPPPSDRDLMKLMMARLAIMEQKVQQQEQEIRHKERRVRVLEDKLRIVGQSRAAESSTTAACNNDNEGETNSSSNNNSQRRVQELEQHCLLLQQQVHEMETFLADYGMVWVGDQDDPTSDIYVDDTDDDQRRRDKQAEAGLVLDDAEGPVTDQPFKIDFDRLLNNIRDLNVIAGEGEAHVQRTTDGARLRRQEPVPITFYENGLLMFEGPFRPYTDPTALQCIQDFLDGYFPSELQSKFPEGVPFSVRDMREVYFKPKRASDVFSGVGNTLGGEIQPSRLIPTKLKEKDATQHAASSSDKNVTSELPFPPTKVEVFLSRLPKSVVKDGKVIDIRDSVGKTLTGESSQDKVHVSVVETAVTKTMQSSMSKARQDRPKTPRDITTLRIKSEDGSHTYIVKMRFRETVGNLRGYLDAHRVGGQTREYEICSTYPRKTFIDDQATMEACGLVPNGVLYLQVKKNT